MTYVEVVIHLNNYIYALKTIANSKQGDELVTLNIMIGFNKYILKKFSCLQAELQANNKLIEQNNLDSSDINNLMKEIISILANDIDKTLDSNISFYWTLEQATFIIGVVLGLVVIPILITTMHAAIMASMGVLVGHILIFALMLLTVISLGVGIVAQENKETLLKYPRVNDIITNAEPKKYEYDSVETISERVQITRRISCFFDEKMTNLRNDVNEEFQATNNQLI